MQASHVQWKHSRIGHHKICQYAYIIWYMLPGRIQGMLPAQGMLRFLQQGSKADGCAGCKCLAVVTAACTATHWLCTLQPTAADPDLSCPASHVPTWCRQGVEAVCQNEPHLNDAYGRLEAHYMNPGCPLPCPALAPPAPPVTPSCTKEPPFTSACRMQSVITPLAI